MPSCGAFPTARPRGRAGSPRRSATNFSTMGSTSLTVAFRTGVTAEARAGLSEWMPSLMRTCPTGSEPTRTPCHDGPHRCLYGPRATRGALQRVEHSHQQTAASPQAAPTSPSRLGAEIATRCMGFAWSSPRVRPSARRNGAWGRIFGGDSAARSARGGKWLGAAAAAREASARAEFRDRTDLVAKDRRQSMAEHVFGENRFRLGTSDAYHEAR
jgi:hypothetical protein